MDNRASLSVAVARLAVVDMLPASEPPRACSTCREVKPAADFHWRYRDRGVRQLVCRPCKAGYARRWYERHGSKQRVAAARRAAVIRARNQAFVDATKAAPCTDCAARLAPHLMDFDHVRGVKRANVSRLVVMGASLATIADEIAKCELVCAHCHRTRTLQRARARRAEERAARAYDWRTPP